MKQKSFHFRPYLHKKYNPQPHSCARCANRPIDFSCTFDSHRTTPLPCWGWKAGVTEDMINKASVLDARYGTLDHIEGLRDYFTFWVRFPKIPNMVMK